MSDEVVWGVSRGEYSDYRVLCICRSEADAKVVAAKVDALETYEKSRVENFLMVDAGVTSVDILAMQVELWDDGTEGTLRQSIETTLPFLAYHSTDPVRWRWVRAPIHQNCGGRLEVSGLDHERVRRVFSDRKAQIKAEDALRMRGEVKG